MASGITSTVLPEKLRAALLAAARAALPQEACGVLVGKDGVVTRIEPARNVAAHPERNFEIEPATLLRVHREARGEGLAVLGYWHSHPGGNTEPSRTDAARAVDDGMLWVIVSGEAACGWRVVPGGTIAGRFAAVTLRDA